MHHTSLIIKSVIIFLCLGYFPNTQAVTNKLACAFKSEQQLLGGLPEFSHSHLPLLGYQCQLIPHYSHFLGNWLPTAPSLYLSQSNHPSARNNSANNSTSQAWRIAFSIKRFGQSQLSIYSGKKDWQQILKAKETIAFIPSNAKSVSNAIALNTGQQVRLNRQEDYWGLSLILPSRDDQILTEVLLQKTLISQPIQANVFSFDTRSLFPALVKIDELIIASQSFHRGLNINWKFGIGKGHVTLESKSNIDFDTKLGQITSIRGEFELYYQHRFNRRWFSHLGWQSSIQYWQQTSDDKNFQLASAKNVEQQVFIGIGLTF